MRIWKGLEVEDCQNEMTLFVEAAIVDERVISLVVEKLNENSDVKRVYFGAGGVSNSETLVGVTGNIDRIHTQKVAEVHSKNISKIDTSCFDKVIMTTPVEDIGNVFPKIETGTTLKVFSEGMVVDYSEVENGLYLHDIEIYKE
jgi:hypothetical protein